MSHTCVKSRCCLATAILMGAVSVPAERAGAQTIPDMAAAAATSAAPGPLARLVRNPNTAGGSPPYALTDQSGTIQRYVEPVPGINLEPYVGTIVTVRYDTGRTLLASQLDLPAPPQPQGGALAARLGASLSGVRQAQHVEPLSSNDDSQLGGPMPIDPADPVNPAVGAPPWGNGGPGANVPPVYLDGPMINGGPSCPPCPPVTICQQPVDAWIMPEGVVYCPQACPQLYCQPAAAPTASMWTLQGEWLFWNARQTELDYAVPFVVGVLPTTSGNVYAVDPDFDHGFRVGGEAKIGQASLELQYTYFQTGQFSGVTDANGFLWGTLIFEFSSVQNWNDMRLAQADWDLDYHAADINAGYYFEAGSRFEGQLQAGVKYAMIDQTFNTLYSQFTNIYVAPNDVDEVFQRTEMDALGPNLGVSGQYALTNRIRLFSSLMYSPLVGRFDQHFTYITSVDGLATTFTDVNLHEKTTRLVSVFDVRLGLELALYSSGTREVTAFAGYELQSWLNYPGFLKYNTGVAVPEIDRYVSNLGFDGLFVGASAGF